MPELTLVQTVNHTLRKALETDDRVVIFGEDVGRNGGVFRATDGLQKDFGERRVFDTPLAEAGIIGAAIGMAVYGLKPVPEIQFQDFIFPAFDQLVSEAAKIRYRSGGQYTVPMIVRTPYGGGIKGGHYHSQSGEAYFAHTPGLKVVIPSTPHDLKGLFFSCLKQEDPVLFMEPKRIYRAIKGDVPEKEYTVPLEKVNVARPGDDVSIFSYGSMLHVAMVAAQEAEKKGIECEVVDLRTLNPLDEDGVLASAKKTGRVVSVYEAPQFCGYGAEISALVAENIIEYMEGPILRVGGFDTPFPYSLENVYLPNSDRVLKAIEAVYNY